MAGERLQAKMGTFYRSSVGQIWCCFQARPLVKDYGTHTQSYCVRVNDGYVNYFLDDHSFDPGGEMEDQLVEIVSAEEAILESSLSRELLAHQGVDGGVHLGIQRP
jgi:hypothetical protein